MQHHHSNSTSKKPKCPEFSPQGCKFGHGAGTIKGPLGKYPLNIDF